MLEIKTAMSIALSCVELFVVVLAWEHQHKGVPIVDQCDLESMITDQIRSDDECWLGLVIIDIRHMMVTAPHLSPPFLGLSTATRSDEIFTVPIQLDWMNIRHTDVHTRCVGQSIDEPVVHSINQSINRSIDQGTA